MHTEEYVFSKIAEAIEPFEGYKKALGRLSAMPEGYGLCFAYHYTIADICNGGISQLYSNSTWALALKATQACEAASSAELASLLKQVILYYHQKGRSRFKTQLSEDFFKEISTPMFKSLSELETEFFELGVTRNEVIPRLLQKEALWSNA